MLRSRRHAPVLNSGYLSVGGTQCLRSNYRRFISEFPRKSRLVYDSIIVTLSAPSRASFMSESFVLAVDHLTLTKKTPAQRTIPPSLVGRLDDGHDDVARNARRRPTRAGTNRLPVSSLVHFLFAIPTDVLWFRYRNNRRTNQP